MNEKSIPSVANVWLGTESGLLKSVDLVKKTATNHFFKENFGKEQEICRMCWNHGDKQSLFVGNKKGNIRKFDFETKTFSDFFAIPEYEVDKERLIGMYKTENRFITCTSRGHLKLWNQENVEELTSISTGLDTQCMAYQASNNLLATGGKENCLKLWDASAPEQPLFRAKNVKHDWLQLRVPIMVMNVKFIPESSKILTTTGTHSIRIYDPKSPARRPVIETSFGEFPITATSVSDREPYRVLVGNTRGDVASFDTRKLKHIIRRYKGFAGSVRDIVTHVSLPYIFSCGLDRHLYVHHEDQTKVLQKVYLKSRLNCLLVTDNDIFEKSKSSVSSAKRKLSVLDDEDEEGLDKMWDTMENVEESADEICSDLSDSENQNIDKAKNSENKRRKIQKKKKNIF